MQGVEIDGMGEGAAVFYSRRLLSKDGPLAAAWLAAHFCRKLRKHHIDKTSILLSVDAILLSEVPIALRLLGYLLLGVVRIYAKKVEYVYHESNEVLLGIRNTCFSGKRKYYGESSLDPALSFVIPEKFELDSFNLGVLDENVIKKTRTEDSRAIGANQSLFTAMILYKEGIADNRHGSLLSWDVFPPENATIDLEATYLHKKSNSEASLETLLDPELPQEGSLQRLLDHESPQEAILDIEVLCHTIISQEPFLAHNEFGNEVFQLCLNKNLDRISDEVESSKLIEQKQLRCEDHVFTDNFCGDIIEKFDDSIKKSVTCEELTADKTSTSISISRFSSSRANFSSIPEPEYLLVPTPRKEESRAPKKRKHSLDGSIVLSNGVIRKGLRNANDLVRKRKKVSCSVLAAWNAHKNLIVRHNFLELINPYMSPQLKAVFQQVYSHHKIQNDNECIEIGADQATIKSAIFAFADDTSESANLLSNASFSDQSNPSHEQSPEMRDGLVFNASPQFFSEVEPQMSDSSANNSFHSNTCSFPEYLSKSPTTPSKHKEPRIIHPPATPELGSEAGSPGIVLDLSNEVFSAYEDCQNQDWWSNRTRVVARCLENCFAHKIQQTNVASLSLTKLANTRSRTTCAQFFYEILVLKSSGHIDVEQHSPYGDIFLNANPALKTLS